MTRLLRTALQNPRITREIGLESGNDCLAYRIIIKSVERAADHAVKIAQNVLSLKHGLDNGTYEKIEKMSNTAIKMLDSSMESLFRQDYNTADAIIDSIKEISALEKEAIESSQLDIEDGAILRLIIESIRRTAEYASDISEIVLNITVDSILV